MPLPAALAARLARRGIIEDQPAPRSTANKQQSGGEEVEEVFAEDYDDPSRPDTQTDTTTEQPTAHLEPHQPVAPAPSLPPGIADVVGEAPLFYETTACPNRRNRYHECVPYCKKRYGMREWDPDEDMKKRRDRMLLKYPLPEGWVEVGDYDTGRFYYWNIYSDEVSWLSPSHPKAAISQSAEKLGLVGKIGVLDSDGEENMETSLAHENSDSGSDTSLSDEEEDFTERLNRSNKAKGKRAPPGKQSKKDELDPMDPASYSDIPRGGWSEGLDQKGKAKTGVDVTASGPLFQQRPYPSPGEILRANQSAKKKK